MLRDLFTSKMALALRVKRLEDLAVRLNTDLRTLETDHQNTLMQLRKLSGRFYGGQRPNESLPESREERKREAFKKLGIVPGQPVDLRTKEAK